jgi:hypothetical protein
VRARVVRVMCVVWCGMVCVVCGVVCVCVCARARGGRLDIIDHAACDSDGVANDTHFESDDIITSGAEPLTRPARIAVTPCAAAAPCVVM